jgi:hypothetical protein
LTDVDDDSIALLRQLGDVLKRSAADDLAALLSGAKKLAIVPKNWRPTQGDRVPSDRAPRQLKRELPSAAAVRAQLVDARVSDERQKILIDLEMTQAEARRMAADLGVKGASKATPQVAISRIVAYFADLDLAAQA